MELYAIKYGETTLPESWVFEGGDKEKILPITFTIFLVKSSDRLILVDAGCDDMPGWDMRHFCPPTEVLARMEIAPEDVTDVVQTHSHYDHFAAIGHYKSSRIYVNSAEYTDELKSRISDSAEVVLCGDETEIAEGIILRKIGGHSAGSSVVELYVDDKIYVLSGDECYSPLCIERKIPTGMRHNPEKAREFVEKYSDPCYTVLVCHDKSWLPGENGCQKIF